ncbi:HNH endonuclease [Marinobacter oulmenensis]|uniref:Putative HNH nuclease YajD n=2 Tax=Marinobacter oulmenensis TaxID=643747 RepID=A0A840UJ39_9GAMM|nr:HNH endonuclease signature motif containing protein [Marinobacter oulmenensis]MBB5322325.1 5-methylcytosine-specific restriction protein A [Marinobacter oulmenensis]
MPGAIPTPCRAATCPAVTINRNGYCDAHQDKASGWMNQDRGSSAERGYGGRWKRIRARIMRRDKALCQPCLAEGKVMPAVAVDHIINKAEGGTDADENLQAICKRCHKLKTQQESLRARGRG